MKQESPDRQPQRQREQSIAEALAERDALVAVANARVLSHILQVGNVSAESLTQAFVDARMSS